MARNCPEAMEHRVTIQKRMWARKLPGERKDREGTPVARSCPSAAQQGVSRSKNLEGQPWFEVFMV